MASLTAPELKRLAAICARLGSPFDGERVAAATLVTEFLSARNLGWEDVLHAEPPVPVVVQADRTWRQCAEQVLFDHTGALTEWETTFLQSVLRKGWAPTPKQAAVLERLLKKTGVPGWTP